MFELRRLQLLDNDLGQNNLALAGSSDDDDDDPTLPDLKRMIRRYLYVLGYSESQQIYSVDSAF